MRLTCIAIVAAVYAALFSSTASAQSGWTVLNSWSLNDLSGVHFINVDTGYAVGASATVLRTTNAGVSWQNVSPSGITANFNGVYAFNEPANRVVAVGDGGAIQLSTDGGNHWTSVSSGLTDDLYSVSFMGGGGICGGGSQSILNTTDAGSSWSIVQSGFFGGGFRGTCMLSPQIGMVGGENSIFQPLFGRTTDTGNNWSFVAFYLNSNEGRVNGIDFTDVSRGYAAAAVWDGRGGVARTTDGGDTWTTTFFPSDLYGINFPISATGLVGYAVGDSGRIIKTTDAGDTWRQLTSGTPASLRGVHFLDFDEGYVVGDGGTILKTTTGGEPPAAVEASSGQLPSSPVLHRNYPNPFNPLTNLQLSISNCQLTILRVYNILGQEVATLVNEVKPPGEYTVTWDASNVPSGVYLCRLEAGGFVQTIKMILLR